MKNSKRDCCIFFLSIDLLLLGDEGMGDLDGINLRISILVGEVSVAALSLDVSER